MKQFSMIFLVLAGIFTAHYATAASSQITYRYDDLGRLKKALYQDGHYVEYRYDPVGNFTTVTVGSDGKAERIGAYYQGSWYLDINNNGAWEPGSDFYGYFGTTAMTPVAGDWNGDGYSKFGAYVGGTWYFDMNSNGFWDSEPTDQMLTTFGGAPGDIPVTGDWNGDGVTEIGFYRPSTHTWYLDYSGNFGYDPAVDITASFGFTGCIPVVGDWNGDGHDKIGVYANGQWYLDTNGNFSWDGTPDDTLAPNFGATDMLPVTGDWIGTGVDLIGAYRNGDWYLDIDGNGIWDSAIDKYLGPFGITGMTPMVGRW